MAQQSAKVRSRSIRQITAADLLAEPLAKEAFEKLLGWGSRENELLKLVLAIPGASSESLRSGN